MASSKLKMSLYEKGVTISDIAKKAEVSPRSAGTAINRWEGKVGNPRGKTRKVLKIVEQEIGCSIYQESL